MTSRRYTPTGSPLRLSLVLSLSLGLASTFIGGCAALPEDAPVMEQLDAETGVTIARLGRPVELYRETFQQNPAGRFAFLGPFETNQMGKRELYLWLALPVDPVPGEEPVLELDGAVLTLPASSREAASAGLTRSPYKIPTPWSAMFYYRVDEALVTKLGNAGQLSIRVTETTKDGTTKTQFASKVPDSRLKDFASR
jgi:hypothetical protein